MEVYFILLLLVLFGVFLKEDMLAKLYYRFAVIILFCVSTFRASNIGRDYSTYIRYFKRMVYNGSDIFPEQGYNILCKVVGNISDSPFMLAASVNLMLFIPLFYYVNRSTLKLKDKFIVLFIFLSNPYLYLQTTTNMMRQCCATGIVLLAIILFGMVKKNLIYRNFLLILVVLLATQFHRSSLITLIIIPLSFMRLNGRIWMGIAFFSLFLGTILTPEMIGVVGRLLGYTGYTTFEASLLNNPIYIIGMFLYTLFICASYDELAKKSDMTFFVDVYLFSLCMLLFAVKNDAVYRIRIYFLYISLPALPYIISQLAVKKEFAVAHLGRFRLDKLIVQLQYFYYLAFYIGYIGLLAYKNNTYYVPFKFGF